MLILAATSPCAAAAIKSNRDQSECVQRLSEQVERDLNDQWRATLYVVKQENAENRREKANKPDLVQGLLQSQRAWLRYRQAQCGMISDQFAGGTGWGDYLTYCLIDLTRQRTYVLKKRISGIMPPFP